MSKATTEIRRKCLAGEPLTEAEVALVKLSPELRDYRAALDIAMQHPVAATPPATADRAILSHSQRMCRRRRPQLIWRIALAAAAALAIAIGGRIWLATAPPPPAPDQIAIAAPPAGEQPAATAEAELWQNDAIAETLFQIEAELAFLDQPDPAMSELVNDLL